MQDLVNGLPNDVVKMNVQCSSNQTQPHPLGATKDHQVPTSKQPAVLGSESYQGPTFFCVFFSGSSSSWKISFQKIRELRVFPTPKIASTQFRFLGVFVVPASDHCNNLFPRWGLNPCILEHVTWWVCSDETCEAAWREKPPSGWFPAKKSSYLPYGCYIHVLVYTLWFMIFECD